MGKLQEEELNKMKNDLEESRKLNEKLSKCLAIKFESQNGIEKCLHYYFIIYKTCHRILPIAYVPHTIFSRNMAKIDSHCFR